MWGIISFPLGSGAKPQPLTVFLFFWHNETHSRTEKCELSETRGWMSQGPNIGDEGSCLSGGRAPQGTKSAPMSVWRLLIIFGGPNPVTLWPWAWLPHIFSTWKIVCKKHFAQHKFWSRCIPRAHLIFFKHLKKKILCLYLLSTIS